MTTSSLAAATAKPVGVAPGRTEGSPPADDGGTPRQAAMTTSSLAAATAKPVGVAPGRTEGSPPADDGGTPRQVAMISSIRGDNTFNVMTSMTSITTSLIDLNDIITRAASSLFSPVAHSSTRSSVVVRLTKNDKYMLDSLISDYSETMGNVFEKSIMLYRAIVEAGEQGGKLLMITSNSRTQTMTSGLVANDKYWNGNGYKNFNGHEEPEQIATVARSVDQEIILAVRDQFAEKGKTPISLNRTYIKATKGLKSERIAVRASSIFMDKLADTERRTGSSKSNLFRDSLHLYNFIKREFDKGGVLFYIGDTQVEGI